MDRIKIYQKDGYLDFKNILSTEIPFVFIFGSRGVGKTYGALKYLKENNIPFVFSRRIQNELDLISNPQFFPYNKLNEDMGWSVCLKSINKYQSAFYDGVQTDEGIQPEGLPFAITSALSTFANVRGFDASRFEVWLFDEFIPESHVRKIRDEGIAFLNAYETMNRNRELSGAKPMTTICLANSNRLANPIFMELGLVEIASKMESKGWNQYIDPKKRFLLINPFDSPIAQEKKETILYQLANKNGAFYKMAVENVFTDSIGKESISRNLTDYKPLVQLGELCIYRHKNERKFFVSSHISGSPKYFGVNETEIMRFMNAYRFLWTAYIGNKMEFETYTLEALWNSYIG